MVFAPAQDNPLVDTEPDSTVSERNGLTFVEHVGDAHQWSRDLGDSKARRSHRAPSSNQPVEGSTALVIDQFAIGRAVRPTASAVLLDRNARTEVLR